MVETVQRTVRSRIATGTITALGTVRPRPVLSGRIIVANRIASAVAVVAFLGLLARGDPRDALLVLGCGLVLLLALGAVLLVAMPSDVRGQRRDTGSRRGRRRWPVPWTLPLRKAGQSRTVDVFSLSVKEFTGADHLCEVFGRLAPVGPDKGDIVEVYGRRDRSGTVRVRELVTVATGQSARPRSSFSVVATRMAGFGVLGCWCAIVAVLGYFLAFPG
jgi:hypothetical protein